MLGRPERRFAPALVLSALMTLSLPGSVFGQAWELERERGVGGGPAPAKVATQTAPAETADKKVGVTIVIDEAAPTVIRQAEGVPVSPFDPVAGVEADATNAEAKAKALVAAAHAEAAAAAAALRSNAGVDRPAAVTAPVVDQPVPVADTRATPPTAAELLKASTPKPIETTTLAALPAGGHDHQPVKRPDGLAGSLEQAQFSPNTAAEPKALVAPRASEAPSAVIMPSPRKPVQPEATVQQTALAPNLGAAPKENVLRKAPAPDNTLVELVETPTDYSLVVAAGKGELLNLGKPVSDVFVADPNVADVNVRSATQLVVHGNALGQTNIFGIDQRGDVIFAVDVDVVPNANAAQKQITAVSPATGATVSERSGTLVADGQVAGVGEAINVAAVTEELQRTQGPTVNNTTIT
ncbi:MAG: pilus assembly protein N-terminal domain-containing protein, partial [Pseudomonadota bacterium]